MYTNNCQRGAALIVALIMLVIMTMLGLSAMNTSVVEERMAGNVRNKQLSFDASEAGVRAGEANISCNGCFLFTVEPKDGVAYPGLHTPEMDASKSEWWQKDMWWDSDLAHTPDTKWQVRADTVMPNIAAQPNYIIEYIAPFYRDINCAMTQGQPQDCERYAYRVTARGWGANTSSVSVLQTMYSDRD
jgi:type IV pilus assembly protein PilX